MTGVLIAGTASGVGKTTVTLALLAAMRLRGLIVQACKSGPDFLDTGHHTRISGRPARNLDTWMLGLETNKDVLRQAAQGADAVLTEGMMGLFDGKDGATESGSSAEIAKLLELPVILVVDAGKSARSIAAVVLGFELFDSQLRLAGVVLNRVAGDRHFRMLEAAVLSVCKTPVLGWLPRDSAIAIPERHLGLQTAEELGEREDQAVITEKQIDALGMLAEKHLDVDRILSFECGLDLHSKPVPSQSVDAGSVRIGVARDHAFSFYYEDNFDLLRQHGAVIVPFSPLHDPSVPENIDALYLGGGYPELYAEQLSANAAMRASIRAFAASGRPVYAECGGMIYLSQQLTLTNGIAYSMAGVFPFVMEMTGKLQQFANVTVELTDDCLLGARGTVIRGHSFHYSRMLDASGADTHYRVHYSLLDKQENEGYGVGNVLASYIHLHFRAAPAVALHFVEAARKMQGAHTVSTGM